MYKRVLIGLGLLVLIAVLGVLFGFWLSWHAPVDRVVEAPQPATLSEQAPPLVMGPDGTLGVPEPPQPRVDGSRGLPTRPVVPASTLPGQLQEPPGGIIGAVAPGTQQALGVPPVTGIEVPPDQPPISSMQQTPLQPLQPLGAPRRVAEPSSVAVPTVVAGPQGDWVQALRGELARCSALGAGRGACVDQARWKYCNPQHRWGAVPECPQTGNN